MTATAAQQKNLRLYGAAALILLLLIAAAWRWTPLHEFAEPKTIAAWLRGLRDSPWAPLVIIAVYVGANALLFPNTILNVATILGLGIGPAVAVHEGSTLLVVINALRLLAYRDPAGNAA